MKKTKLTIKSNSHHDKKIRQIDKEISMHRKNFETGHKSYEISSHPYQRSKFKRIEQPNHPITKYLKRSSYLITVFFSLVLMSYLFGNNKSLLIYAIFGIIVWAISHTLHSQGHSLAKSYVILGLTILILYGVYILTDSTISLISVILYSVSFIIATLLYMKHFGHYGETHRSFSKTFLVVLYSHVVSFSLSTFVMYILMQNLFKDMFISSLPAIISFTFIPLLVYFFLNKYLYLHFFDKKHVILDMRLSFWHTIVYTKIFLICIIIIYFLTMIQIDLNTDKEFESVYDQTITDLENINLKFDAFELQNPGSNNLRVFKLIKNYNTEGINEIKSYKKSYETSYKTTLMDYLTDKHFMKITQKQLLIYKMKSKNVEIHEAKQDLIREYNRIQTQQYLDNNFQNELNEYILFKFIPYTKPKDIQYIEEKMTKWKNSYVGYMKDGYIVNFLSIYNMDFESISNPQNKFTKSLFISETKTKTMRDLMTYLVTKIIHEAETVRYPGYISLLYDDLRNSETKIGDINSRKQSDDEILSDMIQKSILKTNDQALLALSEE